VLEVIDGRPIESWTITTMAKLDIGIKSHQEQLPPFFTKLACYPIILGLPWLQLQHVRVKFQRRPIGLESSYCQQHCQYHLSMWVWGNHMETVPDPEKLMLDTCAVTASPFIRRIKSKCSHFTPLRSTRYTKHEE
jgi:hypothetical protein